MSRKKEHPLLENVRITDIGAEGNALARVENMVVFVPMLIPGDVVYADYAIGRYDLHGANADQLKKSLYRLADLEVDMLLPGHNQIVKGLPPDYVRKTAKMWEAYLV